MSLPSSNDSAPAVEQDSTRWFAAEVQLHEPKLRSFLRGMFPAVRDVDDIVQESYLRVWRRQAARPIESAKGFLFQVARRLALDSLRRDRLSRARQLEEAGAAPVVDDQPDSATTAGDQELYDLLADALIGLPARCREVTLLRKIHGMSQREVATRLGLSERTVENQCRRGVKRCEAYLRARGVNHRYRDES